VAKKKVLHVDADPRSLRVIEVSLRKAGYNVVAAEDGEAALVCAASHGRVDLLLTDMVMPKLGGVELARILCERNPDTAVLYMSGHPDVVVRQRSELGPNAAWIAKPFTVSKLLEEVRNRLKFS
jgi:two-component system cell cycle sensor histidine kinase/response regulator CckA